MEQKPTPIAFLFEDVAVNSPTHVDNLIDNMSDEQANFMLVKAVQMAYKSGIYSLTEAEIISKALRVLK